MPSQIELTTQIISALYSFHETAVLVECSPDKGCRLKVGKSVFLSHPVYLKSGK
jgi:hypothetical protein